MNRDPLLLSSTTANCRKPGVDPEDFFPRAGATYSSAVAKARRQCNGWDACREYGVRPLSTGALYPMRSAS